MTIQRAALLLIAAVLGVRLAFIALRPMEVTEATPGDERYYRHVALRLLDDGMYAEFGARAYRPPGYPAFVAAVFAVTNRSEVALQVLQHLLLLAAAAALAVASARIAGPTAGLVCFLLAAADPVWLSTPQHMLSETLFTLLAAVIALLLADRPPMRPPTLAAAVAVGLLAGASTLVREVGLLVAAVTTAIFAWRGHVDGGPRRAALLGAGVALSAAVVVAPWTVRNAIVLGAFVPISTGSSLNLYIGNNPEATGGFHWAIPGAASDFERDEVGVSRQAGRAAIEFVRAHPQRALELAPVKLWNLWRPMWPGPSTTGPDRLLQIAMALYWPPLLALGLYGIWLERRHPLAWMLIGLASTASLAHIATFGLPRFRTPWQFLWTSLAAVALVTLTGQRSGGAQAGLAATGRPIIRPGQ